MRKYSIASSLKLNVGIPGDKHDSSLSNTWWAVFLFQYLFGLAFSNLSIKATKMGLISVMDELKDD